MKNRKARDVFTSKDTKETQKKADFITVISEVEDEEADEINPLEMV